MARVAAIVLNWRRPLDTVRCVSSLIALGRDLDIIVLDNDSGDGSLGVIEDGLAAIIVVAALVTPPDMISPFLLAGPIYLLYEVSIWCVRLLEFRRGDQGRDHDDPHEGVAPALAQGGGPHHPRQAG